jgi:hypothetical protein
MDVVGDEEAIARGRTGSENVSGNELMVKKLECRRKNVGETSSSFVGGDTSELA